MGDKKNIPSCHLTSVGARARVRRDRGDGDSADAAAYPDRLLRRGPVGAWRRAVAGGARQGGGRAGHHRLLRGGVPGADAGAPLRAALFDGAIRPLFALPLDTKLRNNYGADKPLYGYRGGVPGLAVAYESLAIADRMERENVQAFADLMWPGGNNAGFCETVHGAAARMAELEEAVRRMVMEGLGVAKYHDALSEAPCHMFRMSEYQAPGGGGAGDKTVRYGAHQDCSTISLVCQHDVGGLEVQTRDGGWIFVKPSSLVVMAGNALRAWTNDRVHAPFHRVTVSGSAPRYSAILFVVPGFKIQAPEELVDDDHPRRFKPMSNDEFILFCAAQAADRHQDNLSAYCGVETSSQI